MDAYNEYLFNCYAEGDIWNEMYRPYTKEEWEQYGKPLYGGASLRPCPENKEPKNCMLCSEEKRISCDIAANQVFTK